MDEPDLFARCSQWMRTPWFGLLCFVISCVLSTYFYLASKQTGAVTLIFKTVKIAQAGLPVVKILDGEGQQITSNVFGLEVIVWNSGDLPLGISADRIRKPLALALHDNARIIGTEVQDAKNIPKSDISLNVSSDKKSVEVNWRQFDPSDAIKILVIYTADNQASILYAAGL